VAVISNTEKGATFVTHLSTVALDHHHQMRLELSQ